ncbi:MAG: outer membrane lipoprotein carrier protein LolA [Gemmatimonadetes bacterium 13_1_40CM_66_11]|nr:MAG: outer membrane lipoprotein carrier protein LolA [Gemmatimonadetes bacterium 13_1_40CM_66_11]
MTPLLLLLLAVQDPWLALDRASASYDSVRTLQADFVQVVENAMLGDPDTTRGKLFQRRPSYFAMRFTDPKNDRIVADGRHLWLYTPSTTPGQVIRTAIPGTGTTGPNLIGQFVEHPRERYTARYVRSDSTADGAVDVLTLTPRAQDVPYSEATVWIAKRDGLVPRIEILESSGQRRTIMLRNLVVNRAINAREFRFSPTSALRVVDQ